MTTSTTTDRRVQNLTKLHLHTGVLNKVSVHIVVKVEMYHKLTVAVDKTWNMEHPGTFRNIPEHRIIMIIMRKNVQT